jgi:hypothetical protein
MPFYPGTTDDDMQLKPSAINCLAYITGTKNTFVRLLIPLQKSAAFNPNLPLQLYYAVFWSRQLLLLNFSAFPPQIERPFG